MRICILLLFLALCLQSCADNKLKIAVISDVHYLSEGLITEGEHLRKYTFSTGRNPVETGSILDKALADLSESGIDILLIPGDLTKDGEKQSHLDFVNKLRFLSRKDVKIFVIPGNHDINVPNPVGYGQDGLYTVDNVSPEEFEYIYADFGYNTALDKDSASLSYVAGLNDKTWLLAIDSSLYKDYTDRTISSGRISEKTERWIINVLEEAKRKNISVIAMMHHGLVEHIVYQETFFSEYLVEDWRRLAGILADNGVKIIFTGHFHANDITRFTSASGNEIYDIETSSLSAYPYSYRIVDLSGKGLDISTKDIISIPSNPNLAEEGRLKMKEIAKRLALQKLAKSKYNSLPGSVTDKVADIAGDIFILHIQGDEVIDQELKDKILQVTSEMDIPVDLSDEYIELDFFPPDRNVYLPF